MGDIGVNAQEVSVNNGPRTRLEQLAQRAGLGPSDVLRQFPSHARHLGSSATISRATLTRLYRGGTREPRPAVAKVLQEWFGESIGELLGPPRPAPIAGGTIDGQMAAGAGHASVTHALEAAAALDPSAVEHLREAAGILAHDYLTTASLSMFAELITLRDTIYRQMERTRRPRQQAELMLLAGQVCGLLASVSWDLGRVGSATKQAEAAHIYGCVLEHSSLQAWARALQVTFAFWAGQPSRAHHLATTALQHAPAGTARARLHSVNARALAILGARAEVPGELDSAADELGRAGQDGFLDTVGGELAFDRPRRGLCAAAAYVVLGEAERAEREALDAIALFAAIAPHRRWQAGLASAQVDLAAARALRDDLAGAAEALGPVLSLAPHRRTEAIVLRLRAVARSLTTTRYRGARDATELADLISEFAENSLSSTAGSRALPALL
jgi:transcriptional regulator with XRE-family HTH domain